MNAGNDGAADQYQERIPLDELITPNELGDKYYRLLLRYAFYTSIPLVALVAAVIGVAVHLQLLTASDATSGRSWGAMAVGAALAWFATGRLNGALTAFVARRLVNRLNLDMVSARCILGDHQTARALRRRLPLTAEQVRTLTPEVVNSFYGSVLALVAQTVTQTPADEV